MLLPRSGVYSNRFGPALQSVQEVVNHFFGDMIRELLKQIIILALLILEYFEPCV
jgi:hypothetical protein